MAQTMFKDMTVGEAVDFHNAGFDFVLADGRLYKVILDDLETVLDADGNAIRTK